MPPRGGAACVQLPVPVAPARCQTVRWVTSADRFYVGFTCLRGIYPLQLTAVPWPLILATAGCSAVRPPSPPALSWLGTPSAEALLVLGPFDQLVIRVIRKKSLGAGFQLPHQIWLVGWPRLTSVTWQCVPCEATCVLEWDAISRMEVSGQSCCYQLGHTDRPFGAPNPPLCFHYGRVNVCCCAGLSCRNEWTLQPESAGVRTEPVAASRHPAEFTSRCPHCQSANRPNPGPHSH